MRIYIISLMTREMIIERRDKKDSLDLHYDEKSSHAL